jgi:hypothetical protein
MDSRSATYQEALEEDAVIFETFANALAASASHQEQNGHLLTAAMLRRIGRQCRDESLKYRAQAATCCSK